MDKELNGDTNICKQWGGTRNTSLSAIKMGLNKYLTGGVPIRPTRVNIYQSPCAGVANEIQQLP